MEGRDTRWKVPSFFWIPIIICGGLLFIVDIFQLQSYHISSMHQPPEDAFESMRGFLIKTTGCRIPYMDPFDRSIKPFIGGEKRPKCNRGVPALLDSNATALFLVPHAFEHYAIDNPDDLHCCYTPFKRSHTSDKMEFATKCQAFDGTTAIIDEFILAKCVYSNISIYTDYFSFVPIKRQLVQGERPNVLIVGLDGVSRLNFHRQMPKTVDYLHRLFAIELLGYNKVGDNTFPNLIPVLTGLSEDELRTTCWKKKGHFDNCSFIWDKYQENGYLTSFGEDSAWMGIFNYMKQGFRLQPTDYMWGVFNRYVERKIGNSKKLNVYECIGARESYKVFLEYITKFTTVMAMEKMPYFGFFWGASLSHDFLNKPRLGDEDYLSFFKNLKESGRLDDTVLVVMSDHGFRWGGIRETYQGLLEERLPFLFMLLPKRYKHKHNAHAYANLLKNVHRLTTPFDLHETLTDLVAHSDMPAKKERRGYSLFDEISPSRTCDDAGISSHWCTCFESTDIDKNDSVVQESAKFAVDYMNSQLAGYAQCAHLILDEILSARAMSHRPFTSPATTDYMVTLRTAPNDGVFEVTVRSTIAKKTYLFEVTGTISRLNLYGQQSACITDFHLKLYCYCIYSFW